MLRPQELSYDPITLMSGTTTATSRDLTEDSSITYNLRSLVSSGNPGLFSWAQQLELDSVTVTLQYKSTAHSYVDITNDDLRYSTDRWYNEQSADSDLDLSTVPDDVRPIIYNTTLNVFRISTVDTPRTWITPVPNHDSILQLPHTWLGSRSSAQVLTYFQTNTYDSSQHYYLFDTTANKVRKYTQSSSYSTLTDTAQQGVDNTELTTSHSDTLTSGRITISLSDDSIDGDDDVNNIFRIKIDLVEDSETYTIYLPIDLKKK